MTQTLHKGQRAVAPDKGILRTSTDFTDGLCSGYLMQFDDYEGTGLADVDLFPLLMSFLCDSRYSESWRAGYVVGFCEALIENRYLFERVGVPVAG